MSSSFRERGAPPDAKEERAVKGSPSSAPFPSWLERMQNVRARHEAITRNLNTWSSYKNWAERMRNAWGEESAEQTPEPLAPDNTLPPNH